MPKESICTKCAYQGKADVQLAVEGGWGESDSRRWCVKGCNIFDDQKVNRCNMFRPLEKKVSSGS